MSRNLSATEELIISHLEKHPDRSFEIVKLAKVLHRSYNTIQKGLANLVKYGLVGRVSRGKYRILLRDSKPSSEIDIGLLDYFKQKHIIGDFRSILLSLLRGKIPLGIHYANLHIDDVDIDYDQLSWDIGNSQNRGKLKEIIELRSFGTTKIWVYGGSTKETSQPSITVSYSGGENSKGEKLFLTKSSYEEWKKVVNTELSLLSSSLNLSNFRFTQIELNADTNFNHLAQINKFPHNVRIKLKNLDKVFEVYQYEDVGGIVMGRVGVRISDLNALKNISSDDPYAESNKLLDFIINETKSKESYGDSTADFQSLADTINTSVSNMATVIENKVKDSIKFLTDENTKLYEEIKGLKDQYDLDSFQTQKSIDKSNEMFEDSNERFVSSIFKTNQKLTKIEETFSEFTQISNDILLLENSIVNLIKLNQDNTVDLFRQMSDLQKTMNANLINKINIENAQYDQRLNKMLKAQEQQMEVLNKIIKLKEIGLKAKEIKQKKEKKGILTRFLNIFRHRKKGLES